MKPNPSLRSRSGRQTKHQQEKGVALITVLAIVLLMSVLIISFMAMATSELSAAQKDSDNLKARALADAAVNMAIGQIREATTFRVPGSDGVYPWSSQPGAIRTYKPNGDLHSIYKLYSSELMVQSDVQKMLQVDVKKDWDRSPAQWVDMNQPVVVPNGTSPEDMNLAEVYFPIVDPRAKRSRPQDSVEGFDYKDTVNGVVGAGSGGTNGQRLPMPVRWLYVLADGTIGHFGQSNEFIPPPNGGKASKENPIVGRVGFWTDDETCKMNVNTASEGCFWDTPRLSTEEDKHLGQCQPVNGEYQRYPGHPAMVCLSSVLFPHHRLNPQQGNVHNGSTVNGLDMKPLTDDNFTSIWLQSPYIYGGKDNKTSYAGKYAAPELAAASATAPSGGKPRLPSVPNPKHLYNSYDDYVFAATSDASKNPDTIDIKERNTSDIGDGSYAESIPTDRLQQGRFFLTTVSSAPEITMHGTPRMCLWAMDNTVKSGLDTSSINTASRYTIYDALIAFNASLESKGKAAYPYYFQRQDPNSRHSEFYVNSPDPHNAGRSRNEILFNYVHSLASLPIPGFHANGTGVGAYPSLASKYGGTGQTDDLYSICTLMIDYIRNQNLTDPNLQIGNTYTNQSGTVGTTVKFTGQVSSICLCGGSAPHRATWFISSLPRPKGIGRFLTVSEVALHVSCRAHRGPDNTVQGVFLPENLNRLIRDNENYEYQVSLLLEGFVPSQGWGEYRPWCGITLCGGTSARLTSTPTAPNGSGNIEIAKWSMNGKSLAYSATATPGKSDNGSVVSNYGALPEHFVAWGGNLGARFLTDVIQFKPILLSFPAGEEQPFQFSGSADAEASHPRLIISDNPGSATAGFQVNYGGALDPDNLIQVIPLCFPSISGARIELPKTVDATNSSMALRMKAARLSGNLFGPSGLIHSDDIVQSLVPNHGDIRLIAAKRCVMQGQKGNGHDLNAVEYPTFVGHPDYGRLQQAHSFREPVPDFDDIATKGMEGSHKQEFEAGYFDPNLDGGRIKYKPYFAPDFPIKPWSKDLIPIVSRLNSTNIGLGASIGGDANGKMLASKVFDITRYDRSGGDNFLRGQGRPDITGDFDTGVALSPDGPYINRGDEGEVRGAKTSLPSYFSEIKSSNTTAAPRPPAAFSPNRMIPSAGMFGSLPTGVQSNVPWQTLLFRPDAFFTTKDGQSAQKRHYGSMFPSDYLFLDFFWMPVVEPFAISEPFETKGKINMNYQILPFTYITRATALHGLLKSERIAAIPDDKSETYKLAKKETAQAQFNTEQFRFYIDADETLKQWEKRFNDRDPVLQLQKGRIGSKPGAFLSPAEICDQWLVPEGQNLNNMPDFWSKHRLTGDNLKERPYTTLYPRLTTRSNTYRVHVVAQAIRKVKSTDAKGFDPARDIVAAEYRGSYLVQRSIDPTDPDIPDYAWELGGKFPPPVVGDDQLPALDKFYAYRISQVKQFVR